jgi:hypothetical protein
VSNPLSRDEDGHFHVEGEDYLLEGRGVLVSQKIVDEPLVLPERLRSPAIGDARRLHNALVATHVVNQANEALVENGELGIEDFFRFRYQAMTHDARTSSDTE